MAEQAVLGSNDSLAAWFAAYRHLAVTGIRSLSVAQKIGLHLDRFSTFFQESYGHDRISTCLRRDVLAWRQKLRDVPLSAATVNNHIASLSGCTTWIATQAPQLFPMGNPTKGISELAMPPLEPRALSHDQVRTLKNICDRLAQFHHLKGRRHGHGTRTVHAHGRPWRDRAMVFVLLSTGLRREELVRLDLNQVEPATAPALRVVRRARIVRVQGKGKSERSVFLSADARTALADYLEREREGDTTATAHALFLSAAGIPARAGDGRLSPRAINLMLEQIGRWHDAELGDSERHIAPLRPHDLRHTFAFHLAQATGADAYELERRLGHRSQRYIQRYTNPPETVAAGYIEHL